MNWTKKALDGSSTLPDNHSLGEMRKNDAWMGVDSLCAPTESDDSDDKVDNRELLRVLSLIES